MKKLLCFALALVLLLGTATCTVTAEEEGYDLTMWLFQDWTVGRAYEIWTEWAEGYMEINPKVKSITFVGKPDTEIVSGFLAGVSQS